MLKFGKIAFLIIAILLFLSFTAYVIFNLPYHAIYLLSVLVFYALYMLLLENFENKDE
jgi:hypothetical protein